MNDVFGSNAPLLEGHEKAILLLLFWIFLGFIILSAMRQWEQWKDKKKPDPYMDDDNLGSH